VGQWQQKGRADCRKDAEHGGDRHCRRGEQVRRDCRQAHLVGEDGDHGSARQLGGGGHGDRLGGPAWQTASQPVPPARRDDEQASSRQHRKSEADSPGKGRLDQ
jgi:N-methylhydantoinase B/oxoprolinase/acetone carboxylase alpha subunit